jgi:hypothetical protein
LICYIPIGSGPKRFDYDQTKDVWFTFRDGQLYIFHELINEELSAVFDTPVNLHM